MIIDNNPNKKKNFYTAGGNLSWYTICTSIIAADITFEHILSSASNGFSKGLAFASYEWEASLVMILSAVFFIPKFMQVGVLTLPEYMELRYNKTLRVLTACVLLITQFAMMIPILAANGIFMEKMFGVSPVTTILSISILGGIIIFTGGMTSKIWVDQIVFFLFLITASMVLFFSLEAAGGIQQFIENAHGRLTVILPSSDHEIPWTSVMVGGLWIFHLHNNTFFQPVIQTALVSKSLSQTQKGILSAATIKIFTPFLIIVPGIVAYELFEQEIQTTDLALPDLLEHILPDGIIWLVLAGYLGTMFSAFTSYLNATANVLSLDIVQSYLKKDVIEQKSIYITKICIIVVVLLSAIAASVFEIHDTLFHYTQIAFACVTPVSTSVFLFAIYDRKTPAFASVIVLIFGIPLFFILKIFMDISVINLSGLTFLILMGFMTIIRYLFPLTDRLIRMPERFDVKYERNLIVIIWSIFILTCVFFLYAIFYK